MADFIIEPVGMLDTNCYLVPVVASGKLYIIDPGADAETLIAEAKKLDYREAVILLTHAHVDHIGAVGQVAKALNAKVYVHPADLPLYQSRDNQLLPWLPAATDLPEAVTTIPEDDFSIIETPGHTPGGVCFYFKQFPALFVGDTIFAGSVGRTDLPGGNSAQLLKSIHEKLYPLPDDLRLYPGHGPATTMGREKAVNPYL